MKIFLSFDWWITAFLAKKSQTTFLNIHNRMP